MLTDTAIKAAKPQEKPWKLTDAQGLFLLVQPNGAKWWRFKYRYLAKEKLLSLGTYPLVSLKQARERHQEARQQLSQGIDPSAHRQQQKTALHAANTNTLEAIAREWHATFAPTWTETTGPRILSSLVRDAFPWIGKHPIAEIDAPMILAVLRRVEARGVAYSAGKLRQHIGQVFRYAIATGRATRDPSQDLRGALATPTTTHMPTIIDQVEIGHLLRAIDGYTGTLTTQTALRLAPMLFVRPGELRAMRWADLDLDGQSPTWTIPAADMKSRRDHIVPLARQAVELILTLHPLTGHREYCFPALTGHRPMSENTINAALRRMGYDTQTTITGHGFRAMARTLLHEDLGFAPEVIEHQLAHAVPDALGQAYNRTKFIDQRRTMMQTWADHLDTIKAGAEIIPLRSAG